jgi:hypothetical protein
VACAEAVRPGARTRRLILLLALTGALLLAVWLVRAPEPQRLLVGVDDDTLKWTPHPLDVVRRQQALGARAVRIWIPWPAGLGRDELARAALAARHTDVVLAIFGFARDTPRTATARRRFCADAARALDRVPGARAVVVWNEANSPTYWSGTPAEYGALLDGCYPVLHRRGLTVLSSTTSAHAPEAFLRALGRPHVDAYGHNPYPRTPAERPAAQHAVGFVGQGDYARLVSILGRDSEIWYLEDGFQASVPARVRAHYTGRETVATISPSRQARYVEQAIRLAACQPQVRAFFNFELVDEDRLGGWQSGLYWRGARAKPAARAFRRAAELARRGCP